MLWIKTEVGAGEITETIKEAKRLAKQLNAGIEFKFNGVTVLIQENSDVESKVEEYLNDVKLFSE